jgi:hypothetical protein
MRAPLKHRARKNVLSRTRLFRPQLETLEQRLPLGDALPGVEGLPS